MGEFKGTKGKWELVKDKMINSKKADYLILTKGIESKNLFRSIDCSSVTTEEMEANSKLIAAAPELLESLQWLVSKIKNLEGEISLFGMDKCFDAIKKATE